MLKLIATDLDGTLLDDDGKLDDQFYDVMNGVHEKNILFIACSGRFYRTLNEDFKKMKPNIILVAHNGAYIQYSKNGKRIFESSMEYDLVLDVIQFCDSIGIEKYLCTKDYAHLSNPSDDIIKKFKELRVPIKIVKDLKKIDEKITKIGLFCQDGILQDIEKCIHKKYKDMLEYYLVGEIWLDIMNQGINKGNAIRMIQEQFDIGIHETMVFGDYYNDISMFERASFSYAMKNAPEEVKKYANYIAESNNDCGVIKIIQEKIISP